MAASAIRDSSPPSLKEEGLLPSQQRESGPSGDPPHPDKRGRIVEEGLLPSQQEFGTSGDPLHPHNHGRIGEKGHLPLQQESGTSGDPLHPDKRGRNVEEGLLPSQQESRTSGGPPHSDKDGRIVEEGLLPSQQESGTSDGPPHPDKRWRIVGGLVVKALLLLGGALLVRKLTRRTTRWDHAGKVAHTLSGEKFTTEQAARDPETYFNLRLNSCPAAELADGSRVLYVEQAFWRTPERPYRQRFLKVKPCPPELKCDVEVSAYAVRDIEEYRNFCDQPKKQRPQPEEVIRDIAEHLTTVHLSLCKQGQDCLYEGSTPPGGFPNSWNGATYCTSDLRTFKNGEIHCWDRAYNDEGSQVWGVQAGPYEFKPATPNTSHSFLDREFSSTVCDKK